MKKSEPIKKVAVVLTPQEAVVIRQMREFDFGEMVIKKRSGQPYQVVVSKSTIVRYEEGLELKESLAIPPGSELESKEVISLDGIAKLFTKENGQKEKRRK